MIFLSFYRRLVNQHIYIYIYICIFLEGRWKIRQTCDTGLENGDRCQLGNKSIDKLRCFVVHGSTPFPTLGSSSFISYDDTLWVILFTYTYFLFLNSKGIIKVKSSKNLFLIYFMHFSITC